MSIGTNASKKSPPGEASRPPREERNRPAFKAPKKITPRIRRQLLQGALDENLDLLSDQPLGTNRRDREKRRTRLKRWLFGSSIFIGTVASAAFVQNLDLQPARRPQPDTTGPAAAAAATARGPAVEDPSPQWPVERAAAVFPRTIPLSVHTVSIDPGHGGRDGGTSLQFGLLEKDLTLDLSMRLAEALRTAGITTVLTRDRDVEISLAERARVANDARADLFVSIHVNWLPDRSARGFETYYLGLSNDPFLNRLAARENRDSGFSVADTRRLLEAIYTDVRRQQSRRLAEAVQDSLFDALRTRNEDVVSRGVMSAPFAVLVTTEMPAVLAEVACLSNEREARLLAIPSYRQHIAQGLATGIFQYADDVGDASG